MWNIWCSFCSSCMARFTSRSEVATSTMPFEDWEPSEHSPHPSQPEFLMAIGSCETSNTTGCSSTDASHSASPTIQHSFGHWLGLWVFPTGKLCRMRSISEDNESGKSWKACSTICSETTAMTRRGRSMSFWHSSRKQKSSIVSLATIPSGIRAKRTAC